MRTVCLLFVSQSNGNIRFIKKNKPFFSEEVAENVVCNFFDDSYTVDEIVSEVLNNEPDLVGIVCGIGTVLYAARIINSLNQKSLRKIRYVFVTKELENATRIQLYDVVIDVVYELEDMARLAKIDFHKIRRMRFDELPTNHDVFWKMALLNGYIAFYTGEYPAGILQGENKHIGIDTFDDYSKVANELNMNLNSSIIFQGESYDFEKYETVLKNPNIWSHYIFVDENGNIYFDNVDIGIKSVIMHFSDYVNQNIQNDQDDSLFFVKIETVNDYLEFEKVLRNFTQNGEIINPHFYVIDECRFVNHCMLSLFYRGRVKNGCIFPCSTFLMNIGKVTDTKSRKLSNLLAIKSTEDKTCMMKINEENQTSIKLTSNASITREYIVKKNILSNLRKMSRILSSGKVIKISNQFFSLLYDGPSGEAKNATKICVFHVDGKFYLYDGNHGTMLKLDDKLALILEGYIRGGSRKDIRDSLARFYDISVDAADLLVNNGECMLKKSGIFIYDE